MATEAEVVEYLNALQWPVSPAMFNALFRASPTVTFELVVLDESADDLKAVLLERPADDTEFPGTLHVPGTVMRLGDTELTALNRLIKELDGARLSNPTSVDVLDFPRGSGFDECSRGQIVPRLYVSYLLGGALPKSAMLADVRNLPIERFGWPFQRHLVARAVTYHENGE